MRKIIVAAAVAGSIGLSAWALESVRSTPGTDPVAVPACSGAECLDSTLCGDEALTCPAGPDCFAPEVCADRDLACPADESALDCEPTEPCCSADA